MKRKPGRFSLRKLNAVVTALIMLLFAVHGVLGAFQMLGAGGTGHKRIARIMAALILVHVIIGVKYTMDSLKVQRKTGTAYFKENRLFWARRISGLSVMVFMFFHMSSFTTAVDGQTRLLPFNGFRLALQILLVLSLAVHIISNVKPLLISFGVKRLRERAFDILFVVSVLLLFMAGGFAVYYLRWRL